MRAFLLTNLVSTTPGGPLRWRIPHFLISDAALEEIGKFPYEEGSGVSYDGDALFIKGARSRFVPSVPAARSFELMRGGPDTYRRSARGSSGTSFPTHGSRRSTPATGARPALLFPRDRADI